MGNSTIRKGFAVSKDERAMVYEIASCFGYKSNGEVVRDLLKKWSKDKTFEGTLDEIAREKLTTITVIMTMNELNRLNRLCAQYGVPNGKLVRNLIHSFYAEHEQEIAEFGRKDTEEAQANEKAVALMETFDNLAVQSLFPTEGTKNEQKIEEYRKRIDLTEQEYEIAKEREFIHYLPWLIIREYSAVESKNRNVFDFSQEADSGNRSGKKMITLQYKLDGASQTELELLCDFYGKTESEVVRHLLYSDKHGKYDVELDSEASNHKEEISEKLWNAEYESSIDYACNQIIFELKADITHLEFAMEMTTDEIEIVSDASRILEIVLITERWMKNIDMQKNVDVDALRKWLEERLDNARIAYQKATVTLSGQGTML